MRLLVLLHIFAIPCLCVLPTANFVAAAEQSLSSDDGSSDVLDPQQWRRLDDAVDRSLDWLVSRQQPDGSFVTHPLGQPGVTSLCVMAFMAHGHLPGEGRYGPQLQKAVDYVVSCQKPNGLLTVPGPGGKRVSRNVSHEVGVAAVYNHTIASLMLSEVYGISGSSQATQLQPIIEKSLQISLLMQNWPVARKIDQGGWRYLKPYKNIHSDLSLTGWQLMFLRSAKNAGFDVPEEPIERAISYVRRCFNKRHGVFEYTAQDGDGRSRAMAGAGVLAFAHAGLHHTEEARRSGDWILKHNFDQYNVTLNFSRRYPKDRYHYSVFNCSQAMYQLGDKYWQQFFPRLTKTLLANQQRDGSWQAERHYEDAKFGNAYTTSLVILALGAPNQFLPVFQR